MQNVYWSRLSVCLSVPHCIPTLAHGPGCNLGEWYGVPSSYALLGGFSVGAWVSSCDSSAECEMSASACTYCMRG